MRDVGDHGNVEGAAGDAMLRQTVRSRLQDRNLGAGVTHLGQVALDIRGIGGGGMQPGLVALVADDGADGADQPGALAGRDQHAVEQIRRGRLAIGAGDADQRHGAAGVIVPGRAQPGERLPAIRHLDVCRRLHGEGIKRQLADDCRGPTRNGVADVAVAIGAHPAIGDKKRARGDLARVGGDVADLHAVRAGCSDQIRQAEQEAGKLHPPAPIAAPAWRGLGHCSWKRAFPTNRNRGSRSGSVARGRKC